MATYKVKSGQTLFDIALHLYGTIEGLFDLLISNPDINMTSDLVSGMELEYHTEFIINKGIVDKFESEGMEIINGERHTYFKPVTEELRAIIQVPEDLDLMEFTVSGEGQMVIDWGDNSALETIRLSETEDKLISHYFDDNVDERRVRIYGNFSIIRLSTTRMHGDMYLTKPMIVDEYECKSNDNSIVGLFLFDGTYSVDLEHMVVDDLVPIRDMSLSFLNLKGVQFKDSNALTDYLVYVKKNHQNRKACEVHLSTMPSDEGMEAINTIISDNAWNNPIAWKFFINDTLYTYNDNNGTDAN